jgi:hypothetical protein
MCLAASHDLVPRQVDFSNAFVQATLSNDEHVYIRPPKTFETRDGKEENEVVLKLKRSLYGLVQAPLYWGRHLQKALNNHGFHQQQGLYQCLYFGHDTIILTYVYDCLFFSQSNNIIHLIIKNLQDDGFTLTEEREGDEFAFLGVEVTKTENREISLKQQGLTEKILRTCGMEECNTKATPCSSVPMGTDELGPRCEAEWE